MRISIQKCCKCKQELPVEQFSRNCRSSSGYSWTCKSCVKAYKETIKEKEKIYQKEYHAKWQKENKERVVQYIAKWQENNQEKYRASIKKANAKYRLRKKLEKQQQQQQHNEQ